MINTEDKVPRQTVKLVGHDVSVAVAGSGPPMVFLHGNATHAYAWRNIIPYLAMEHRCLAPDWLGMGDSEVEFPSGSGSYQFAERVTLLDMLLEQMEPDRPVVLITHELGTAIALQYARKNRQSVAGIVMIEGVFRVTNDTLFDDDIRSFLDDVRGERGEETVLQQNRLIDFYLPRLIQRDLGAAELEAYRQPFLKPGESRRALLSMIRQLPLQSYPSPLDQEIESARLWCAQTQIPKLVIGGSPGFLVPSQVLGTAARWADTSVASVRGLHYLMEDSPARLTALILDWLAEIGHSAHERGLKPRLAASARVSGPND